MEIYKDKDICGNPQSKCVPLTDCPKLKKMAESKDISAETINFLKESQCGYFEQAYVCCQMEENSSLGPNYNRLLRTPQCGVSSQLQIFGGEVTDIREHPWLARLGFYFG